MTTTPHKKTGPDAAPASNRAGAPTNPKEGTTMVTRNRPGAKPASRSHLTVVEFCAELGIARSTFYDWRAAKKAPRCIKLPNGDIRIRRTEYETWLANLEDAA
ncbi:MAG: helix-turn-helix transcriptional regulator [Streptosporangiales bacterium]